MKKGDDKWDDGEPYEFFMGRWSRLIAPEFLKWLLFPENLTWIDLGCGTGALSEAICLFCKPADVYGIDPSGEFLKKAEKRISGKAIFLQGSATSIPKDDNSADIIVSGLSMNFFPDLSAAFAEMKRVLNKNGTIAAYVWDYADKMEFLRLFWDSAYQLDPGSRKLDEGFRFSICNTQNLIETFKKEGLSDIETTNLDIDTAFRDFDDLWDPFLGGQGPAPSYLASRTERSRAELKEVLRKKINFGPDGSVNLKARALAVRGVKR